MTGSFVIRAARAADQATIVGLVRAARLDPSNLHWPNFVVAEADGQIVGCGQIRPDPGLRELGSMVVIKPYRQRGVGAAIVRALQACLSGEFLRAVWIPGGAAPGSALEAAAEGDAGQPGAAAAAWAAHRHDALGRREFTLDPAPSATGAAHHPGSCGGGWPGRRAPVGHRTSRVGRVARGRLESRASPRTCAPRYR